MAEEDLRKECCRYFQNTAVLRKILDGFVEKYRSYEEVCGKVTIKNLTKIDIEDLEGFTGENYHGRKSASFTADRIQKILDASRFRGVSLKELLEEGRTGALISKKEEQAEKQERYISFYKEILKEYSDTRSGQWMSAVIREHLPEERLLKYRYHHAEGDLAGATHIMLRALNGLPVFKDEYGYLPAFSAEYSGNPHYFDEGQADTQLFYYGIKAILKSKAVIGKGTSAEQKHGLLLEAGLIRDDLSNDVLIFGIRGGKDGKEHAGLKGFYEQKEPFSLTMSTVVKLDYVEAEAHIVYVVENPIVFAKLTEQTDRSVVCTNGQPNLAVLRLLDLLVSNQTVIYYNGDFDPEGLAIAQRLKNRYKEMLKLWKYTKNDYEQSMSDVSIADSRIKAMDRLSDAELLVIAECIRSSRKAGYQEKLFF